MRDPLFDRTWTAPDGITTRVVAGRWRVGDVVFVATILLGLAGLYAAASAETIDGDRITVIDGDTVALPCDPVHGLYPGCAERLRLEGIDAPETRRHRCEAERIAGLAAREALARLLRGHAVDVTRAGHDRYGRTLAHLSADGIDIEAALLAAGHAVPYTPGRAAWGQRCRHWCPGTDRCEE